jgi:gluconolactonase
MKSLLLSSLLVFAFGPAARAEDPKPPPIKFSLERLDPRFDELIDKDAKLEVLAGGFKWAEGPLWHPDGFFLFSDIPNNRIVKWEPKKGASDYLKPAGYNGTRTDLKEPGTNGLTVDSAGRLVVCQHGNRQVARQEKDGKITALAAKYMGKRLNSPNDLTYKSNGDLYFTDPPYGLMVKNTTIIPGLSDKKNFPGIEQDFCGVYRLSKGGKLTVLTKELTKPNGIAFSPDEKTLYVAQSEPLKAIWMAYPVKEDGTLGKGKVFADVTKQVGEKNPGLPDGMKVDAKGNLFASGPGGILVFAPDGTHLGTIRTGVPSGNCAFGPDGMLYICANTNITRIQTKTKAK